MLSGEGIPVLENTKVSWFLDSLIPWFFGFLFPKLLGLKVYGFLGFEVSKFQRFKNVSCFFGSTITKFPCHVVLTDVDPVRKIFNNVHVIFVDRYPSLLKI